MKYLLMICANEAEENAMSPQAMGELLAAYGRYYQEMLEAGVHVGGHRLRPVETATTVRVRQGRTLTQDGPFAETKEQMGGYFIIEAKNLDEAIAWAAKCPSSSIGSIEVRPIWEMEGD